MAGTCKEHMEAASAMIDGEMTWGAKLWLKAHLLICAPCRRYFKQLDRICTALGQVTELECPDPDEFDEQGLLDKMFSSEEG